MKLDIDGLKRVGVFWLILVSIAVFCILLFTFTKIMLSFLLVIMVIIISYEIYDPSISLDQEIDYADI